MKSLLLGLALLLSTTRLFAQKVYWQQQLRYTIEAELNDTEKSITGFETVVYKNNAPNTLDFIWFHLWPNAYKHDSTAMMMQIQSDSSRKEKATAFSPGSIDGLVFKVNGKLAQTQAHANPQYIDITKVVLPAPLLPGDSVVITTPFKVMLPPYFSRSGHADGEFMVCQWYPKPAVFDRQGWHEFPYLDMGEFYSEYADYVVSLTVPSAYVVGATGSLLTQEEAEVYKRIGAKNASSRKKDLTLYTSPFNTPKKTLSYFAKQVPDFAWFADKSFIIQYDTVKLHSGRTIDAFSYYHNKKKTPWVNSIDYIKDAIHHYSTWIGEYEYPTVQAVEGPKNNSSGGMEYPMITLITSPDETAETLDGVITHEVGHNWFMSMLGSNERDHTWMDEGLNTFFQFRYEAEKYRGNSVFGKNIPANVKRLPPDQFLDLVYNAIHKGVPMNSAMDVTASMFPSSREYGLASYIKAALWMRLLEIHVGPEKAQNAIQLYFQQWKNKHPQPADMQASFEKATGENLDDFFGLTKKEGKF
jgi:hypothetical protein